MIKFESGQRVRIKSKGLEGIVCSRREIFYEGSTITKYGMGKMGTPTWGYKVQFVMQDEEGQPRRNAYGQVMTGLSYFAETDLAL